MNPKILIIGTGLSEAIMAKVLSVNKDVEFITDNEAKERGVVFTNTENGLSTSKMPINEMFEIHPYDTENIKSGREKRREKRKQNRNRK